MKKKLNIIISVIALCLLFGCAEQRKLIMFNKAEQYPELDPKLSDVAKISYIPLDMPERPDIDDMPRTLFYEQRGRYRYFSPLNTYKLYVIDKKGKYINGHGKLGAEMVGTPVTQFFILKNGREVCAYDYYNNKISICDKKLNLKSVCNVPAVYPVCKYDNSNLLFYNAYLRDSLSQLLVVYTKNGEIKSTHNVFPNIYHGMKSKPVYAQFTKTKNGYFITNKDKNNDTIYYMDKKFRLSPAFLDKSTYPDPKIFTRISKETKRYLYFNIENIFGTSVIYEPLFYVYDKKKDQIFKLKNPKKSDFTFATINDRGCFFSLPGNEFQQGGYIVTIEYLKANYNTINPELKSLIDNLKEETEAILMTYKMKK